MQEAQNAMGQSPRIRPLMGGSGGGMQRPGPYDRNNRFGMGGGAGNMAMGGNPGMGMSGYGMGRGGRNVKGKSITVSASPVMSDVQQKNRKRPSNEILLRFKHGLQFQRKTELILRFYGSFDQLYRLL